ncbi:hypothetical protein DPMN_052665 [Dreissena polymorpha]|uniref:Uncharacterized protein n=1 Tax=Dreissena polymorpha TaxID=45954 RepID=A0A9D4CK31_DREPO|nr:hypothetical protein DPMN_052665 [Dreissena polymorpha]
MNFYLTLNIQYSFVELKQRFSWSVVNRKHSKDNRELPEDSGYNPTGQQYPVTHAKQGDLQWGQSTPGYPPTP